MGSSRLHTRVGAFFLKPQLSGSSRALTGQQTQQALPDFRGIFKTTPELCFPYCPCGMPWVWGMGTSLCPELPALTVCSGSGMCGSGRCREVADWLCSHGTMTDSGRNTDSGEQLHTGLLRATSTQQRWLSHPFCATNTFIKHTA